ncbi:beta/alpha barrel domain-containing protein [Streptomonospora litoralis]|uniref:N-(5'-phosphoribosyl)anthranilate isomerase n=1 Tax=Streptomonospora litoralis TaxID=2498135 RepID=UPI001F61866C|nr:N-(5'-phosphoribosyl)anthranilate isomerase [Streptomonospora litoralis]
MSAREVAAAAAGGADCVGLWHGIPGGRAELAEHTARGLAAEARSHGVEPVLVTFGDDPAALAAAADRTGVRWVQLHAYQLPRVVGGLRERAPGAVPVKVLHVDGGGRCLELRLADAYARAGTEMFLLDTATADGRVGSTGQALDAVGVLRIADRLPRPFLLAGGVTAARRADYDRVVEHPMFAGVDVDTGARGGDGELSETAVTELSRAWRTGRGRRKERS